MSNNRRLRRMIAQNSGRSAEPTDEHMGCGCHTRHIAPVETVLKCPACGRVTDMVGPDGMPWPTSAEPGELITMAISCECPAGEFEALFEVRH